MIDSGNGLIMGRLDQDICSICVEPARYYSLYHKQRVHFCSSLCHQEYNSRQADKPNLILVQLTNEDEVHSNAVIDDREEDVREREPLLFHVVRNGVNAALEMLLQRDLDVNQKGKKGLTAAMIAAEIGSAEKMQMLLDRGADIVNTTDDEGETVLHKSSHWKNDTKCAELILAISPQLVNRQDNFLQTPLHEAAGEGNVVLLKYLISEGADVNALDNLLRSPLHWAVIQGHTPGVETLLSYNMDDVIDREDRFDNRPIHYAIQACKREVVQLLVNKNCSLEDADTAGGSMLIYAVKHGNREMCELMLRHCNKYVNDADLQGWTALHHAVQRGDTGICQLLLKETSTKNAPDLEHRQTPIYLAVNLCLLEIVSILLDHGVKLLCFDDRKRSPFHYACLKGAANILRMLLAHVQQSHQDNGKKVINAKDSSGQSALNISVSMCDRECCQILLAHEAKVDGQSKPRLIEMGLIARDLKKQKKEKPEKTRPSKDVTTISENTGEEQPNNSLQPLFVPSKKAPISPTNDIQWKELVEKKKRMQKAWHTWKIADEGHTSPYAESVAYNHSQTTPRLPDKGYLQMYAMKRKPDELIADDIDKKLPLGSKSVSNGKQYGQAYSYTMNTSL